MAKIIAISNQKGGVGKTTTSVNLAACLGKMGKKTLLVDADPQGNATSGVAIDKSKVKFSTYSILVDGAKAEQCVLTTPYDNLHILPSSLDSIHPIHRLRGFFPGYIQAFFPRFGLHLDRQILLQPTL